jgi:uncharacterized protein (DUF58 family)
MLPKEILKKIRRIEIVTNNIINTVFAGEYQSVFKGSGMEFEKVREYQPGDDIRTIDWNVTARTGSAHVKRYVEERELTVMLLVDASSSGKFGTFQQMKSEIAAEICALLAFSAIKNNDKVGLIVFTDRVEKYVPPKKGKRHVLRVIREILYFEPEKTHTDIKCALEYLNRVLTRKSVVFLVSDFVSPDFAAALRIANKKHDMIAVTIVDPREVEMPDLGLVELEDAETGEMVLVDTGDPEFRRRFAGNSAAAAAERDKLFRSINVDSISIRTDQSYIDPLMKFFRMRERRMT